MAPGDQTRVFLSLIHTAGGATPPEVDEQEEVNLCLSELFHLPYSLYPSRFSGRSPDCQPVFLKVLLRNAMFTTVSVDVGNNKNVKWTF